MSWSQFLSMGTTTRRWERWEPLLPFALLFPELPAVYLRLSVLEFDVAFQK